MLVADGREIVVAPKTFATPTDLSGTVTGSRLVTVASGQSRAPAITGRALQPAWSPSGARIAFWTVRGRSGQRDILTVAADGSDAAQEAALSPMTRRSTGAPAGHRTGGRRTSSARGGTMNLWRVAIDQATGRLLGEPEPVTTPSICAASPCARLGNPADRCGAQKTRTAPVN